MTTTIHWFRRDLRLLDNTAFLAALRDSDYLIPLFILDERLLNSTRSGVRTGFLADCLHHLDHELREHGSALVIRRGDSTQILHELAQQTGATRITYNRDYSPYARQRDKKAVDFLRENGFLVETYQDLVLHEFKDILNDAGKPLQIFTPYRRRWESLPKPAPQLDLPALPSLPPNLETGDLPTDLSPIKLESPITHAKEAPHLLENFITQNIQQYHHGRDRLDWDGTSRLSPHLRWGTISIRQCYAAALQHEGEGSSVWISELAWRDFYQTILAYYPQVLQKSFRPPYDRIRWENNEDWFGAWCEGRTGYPIIDAAMRQLHQTGWMHNRARMIVASFLCKDLLIDWRWGEQYFMQRLLDGDSAANNGGWQWAAGTGTDAAPYFRIFNPVSQSQKFDPNGDYIRRWLPELAHLDAKIIHTPWKNSTRLDYPAPIVDHAEQRQKALAMYAITKQMTIK